MTDLEPRREHELDHLPVARPQVDLYKNRGLDLTPQEIAQRRSNRRWMLIIAAVAVAIFIPVMISLDLYSAGEPPGPAHGPAPAGEQWLNDSYYAYLVPASWAQNPDGTDGTGDVETSGPSGWVAEHVSYYKDIPTLYETDQPTSLQAFGQKQPLPYTLTNGHPITVTGASGAFEYTMTRPGGFSALVIDSWYAGQDIELWLEVDAPADVTATLVNSLLAGEAH